MATASRVHARGRRPQERAERLRDEGLLRLHVGQRALQRCDERRAEPDERQDDQHVEQRGLFTLLDVRLGDAQQNCVAQPVVKKPEAIDGPPPRDAANAGSIDRSEGGSAEDWPSNSGRSLDHPSLVGDPIGHRIVSTLTPTRPRRDEATAPHGTFETPVRLSFRRRN